MVSESSPNPVIGGIHHVSLLVMNVETSLAFYRGVLGLAVDTSRPAMDFPGVWLQIGTQQIHLIESRLSPHAQTDGHGGRDRHIALAVRDVERLRRRLEAKGIAYTPSRSGRVALFCRDTDGNALEFVEVTAGD